MNDLLKLEEESLGARTDKLADIYQLMSKTKSEVMYNTRITPSISNRDVRSGEKKKNCSFSEVKNEWYMS